MLRGVKVFNVGREREIKQEMGAGMIWTAPQERGSSGIAGSGAAWRKWEEKVQRRLYFNGREKIQKTTVF